MMAHIDAVIIFDFKDVTPEGDIIHMRIWRVPEPVPPSEYGFKYSLFIGRQCRRIVGFDNERGKGDHCHIDGVEHRYVFKDVEHLVEDFIVAVAERRQA